MRKNDDLGSGAGRFGVAITCACDWRGRKQSHCTYLSHRRHRNRKCRPALSAPTASLRGWCVDTRRPLHGDEVANAKAEPTPAQCRRKAVMVASCWVPHLGRT